VGLLHVREQYINNWSQHGFVYFTSSVDYAFPDVLQDPPAVLFILLWIDQVLSYVNIEMHLIKL